VTVRYPNDAPGEIDVQGTAFIQRDRSATASPSPGTQRLATSGDWTLYQRDKTTLLLQTPQGLYTYRSGSNCGSNQAPPS
jgi:hypothetical protein